MLNIDFFMRRDKNYNLFVSVLLLFLVGFWFYRCIALHFDAYNNFCIYGADDIMDYNQAAWNTAEGRLFQYNNRNSEKTILEHGNIKTIDLHSNFIFLFISLFYLFLPHFSSFILIQSLFIALSIITLYLVAKEILTEKKLLPLLIVLIYIQYFPLTSAAHFFHPEEFAMFFIFLAFYFYLKGKLRLTLIFALLSIFCREEISLIFMVLGVMSYFKQDKKRYFFPLTLLGLFSFLFILLVMNKGGAFSIAGVHYGYLGRTYFDKLRNMIFNPSLAINNILRTERIGIFRDIFAPLLYLPFLSPLLLLPAAIILIEVMLSSSWSMGTLRWQPWYLCSLIPFVFIALIGAFENLYRLSNKIFSKINKLLPVILICFLFFYIYIRNANLTESNNNALRDYFSINRYWRDDTFTTLSGIRKDAKVVCSHKLMPMLSSRRYIISLNQLTERIVSQGFYDTIILSESDYNSDIRNYLALMQDSNLYRKAYSIPYMTIFIRKNTPSSLEDWRSNLISEIQNSSLSYDYTILNFNDYAGILENSGAISPEDLAKNLYENDSLYYAKLEQVRSVLDVNAMQFIPDKPLEGNYRYMLAFAAKTENSTDVMYVKKPTDSKNECDEIRIDNKLRLFMLPFNAYRTPQSRIFLIQMNEASSISKPLLLRFPINPSDKAQVNSIFEVKIGKHTISYNPWLKYENFQIKDNQRLQFLIKYIKNNPLVYLIDFLHVTIPGDLYKYSWMPNSRVPAKIIAIRY